MRKYFRKNKKQRLNCFSPPLVPWTRHVINSPPSVPCLPVLPIKQLSIPAQLPLHLQPRVTSHRPTPPHSAHACQQPEEQLYPVEGLTNKWPGISLNASSYFCRKCKAEPLKKPWLVSLGSSTWPRTSSTQLWLFPGYLPEEATEWWEKWERTGRADVAKHPHIWRSWSVSR